MTSGHTTVYMARVDKSDTKVVVVWRLCDRGRQSCSRLCRAQVTNGDPLGRLSDVDVVELGGVW